MKKFKVIVSYVTYVTTEIEAETEEEAYKAASNMDGRDFYSQFTDDWDINEVKEVTT